MIHEPLGATLLDAGRCAFRVWAPNALRVALRFVDSQTPGAADVAAAPADAKSAHADAETERLVLLERDERGYHRVVCEDVEPGALYVFRLDGVIERPDPASRWQPHGVHGPSAVVDPGFAWTDDGWNGRALSEHVFYELHVGTFTPQGTFDAAIERLDALAQLGITTIQLMPIAQFPGARNWGYDGVYPFAVQSSYGGPLALKRFVDACHARGLGVFLDVVYNHLGPEGNYLDAYGPYFTDRYRTPWGRAVNFDSAQSDEVRTYVVENALYWLREFHVDGLRLDAIHGIFDFSAKHILEQLQDAVQAYARRLERPVHVIAESDLNDARVIRAKSEHGFGLDGQWSDDFHHALHVLVTGETNGYYGDFGSIGDLATALREGFVYTGQYSSFRQRSHGNSARGLAAEKFVVCTQNHDQIGNRLLGDRVCTHLGPAAQRLSVAALLLAPQLPMLFMGQEYGDPAPFAYFVSHSDEQLVAAVRRGRKRDFASFAWAGKAPDPQAESTFESSRLDWSLRDQAPHRSLLEFHAELLRLRRSLWPSRSDEAGNGGGALRDNGYHVYADEDARLLVAGRNVAGAPWVALFLLRDAPGEVRVPLGEGKWVLVLDANETRFDGDGTTLPARIESNGHVALPMQAWGCAVLRRA